MEDQTENTLRTHKSLKRDSCDSTTSVDGVYNQKCIYWRREMLQTQPSSQSITKQKRCKEDRKKREITGRRGVFDKHIYYTRCDAYEDKIKMLINFQEKICTFLKHIGLDKNDFLQEYTQRIDILMKDIQKYNYNEDFIILAKLELFLKHYLKTNVLQDKHKTIEAPKLINKFRPLSPVVIREARIDESEDTGNNIISNIVAIQGGVVTYSHHCMTICCMTRNGDRNIVHCPSSATDFTRIAQGTVLATLPFRKTILIINSVSFKIKTLPFGFYKVSYLEHSIFVGVEMFAKTIYLVNWVDMRIKNKFNTKEIPADIAVGPQNNLLISFSNINRVICYNLDGQQLFEVITNSLDLATNITAYKDNFYVLQGHIIYKISATGRVAKRDVGRKCRHISVGTDTILATDYFGVAHIIRTDKDFWPKLSYTQQLRTPSLNNHIYIEDCYNITNILPMSIFSILVIYNNKKIILFADTGEIINQNDLTFLEIPSIVCRFNTNNFLVFYREMKGLQFITCPELKKGPLIRVHTEYIEICHIVSNKVLALTTNENKDEVHILLIKEDKVDIIERISLGHENVTIAATPYNFVVVNGRKNKLVFYSTSGEELFEKYLPFYGFPHHIYTDNVYFYVLFKRESVVVCYSMFGEMKWQWKLPFPVYPHIAVFQGTVYVPDVEFHRILLYRHHDWSSCCLHVKNPYIRNLNLRLKEKENDKLLIAKIRHLANGELVVSDINNDRLLYISNEGDIVFKLSLPSTATDICRWDSNHIGVTLPLEKQLRVIGNLSKAVRTVLLRQPYVRVCKLGEGQIVCYCDKPSHLDILAINKYNQVEIIHRIDIPFVVKSLEIEKETLKLLIVTKRKVFQYNTRIGGGGHAYGRHGRRPHRHGHHCCNIKMVPSILLSQVKPPPNFFGGSIDKMFVYLIENGRMFALKKHNLFDLTVSDKARHIHVPQGFGDRRPVRIAPLVITENNLIAGYDKENKNIKILTFDGRLLDSIKLNVDYDIKMYRWQSNTLVITTKDYGEKYGLLTLKVEFPLSLVIYQTKNTYSYIASFSNNQLLLYKLESGGGVSLYVIEIDEIHLTVNEIKKIDISEPLTRKRLNINPHVGIIITADDVIIVNTSRFVIFVNSDGQYLHSVRHYMAGFGYYDRTTIDDSYLYIQGEWDKYCGYAEYRKIVCLTQTGEYYKIFLNQRFYKHKVDFSSINCKGPKFAGSCHQEENKLYIEGLFMVNRESFSVYRLQTDKCSVQVKDIDISDEGKTVVCEKANSGNVEIFDEDGRLLCHRNVGSLVGGVCFTEERDVMVTLPQRQEIFQLTQQDLEKYKVWQSEVPYGVIWRKVGNIYWCLHINLIECHSIKIDGDQVNILESVSLVKLNSSLHFLSNKSQMNNEIFSNELTNRLKYSGKDEEGRRGKSGEIIGEGRLKVRCGSYIAESMLGSDEISVRRLPYRTAMVPLSIPAFDEPINYNYVDIRDYNSKLIKLDDNVYVLMFRDTVTLISRTTGDILQHKQLPKQQPLGICRWTDERFIVVFDVVDINDGTCKYEVCLGETMKYGKYEGDAVVFDVAVTAFGDVVVVRAEYEEEEDLNYDYDFCLVDWYREESLVRRIELVPGEINFKFDIYRPCLTVVGEYVYITDLENNIYQIPGQTEHQTSENTAKYLLLRWDDNEVFQVLGFDASDNSFMVFGIIPGRQSFAFFHYDK
ncbi:uncharacterized protein LOC115226288 [Octopus sinensis]|uniref:Uncharacterized protein LOC115226288 n=1 Tax=Octopus sinensis TaxID=2607531 RepID=A0A7E6FTM7_9MOLL|nr:uncharacterized protein LOC115226288 [Octopus sinensis]